MRIVTASQLDQLLDYNSLADALKDAFSSDITVPVRHHHTIPQDGTDATLLLMPAWTEQGERFLGCKIVTVFPDNSQSKVPSVQGQYLLMSGDNGSPLALIDGRALTAWRTAAASALAARYLARKDASHLLVVGAGALAPHLVRAHRAVRPIKRVTIWNRSRPRAISTAFGLGATGVATEVSENLEESAREADIISCATLSIQPLIQGTWLKKGAHVDLVGGFTPKMREADDQVIKRAKVYVDTKAGACKEAGDIVVPMKKHILKKADIRGDLFDLCRGKVKGRRTLSEITLFKSVGTGIEDLAAAMLVWHRLATGADKRLSAG